METQKLIVSNLTLQAQAPHPSQIPKNCTMKYWNFFDPVPEEMTGRYDIIHTRLLVLAIEPSQLPSILSSLSKMLKPGGYLQWDELDVVNMGVKKIDTAVPSPALDELVTISRGNGRYDWTLDIPKAMEESGFADVKCEFVGDLPELVRPMGEMHLMTMEEIGVGFAKRGQHEMAAKLYQAIEDAGKEATLGATLYFPRIVCVGRLA